MAGHYAPLPEKLRPGAPLPKPRRRPREEADPERREATLIGSVVSPQRLVGANRTRVEVESSHEAVERLPHTDCFYLRPILEFTCLHSR